MKRIVLIAVCLATAATAWAQPRPHYADMYEGNKQIGKQWASGGNARLERLRDDGTSTVMIYRADSAKIFFDSASKNYICYAAKPNCFLIRADGTVGKCTVALNSEANNVGKLRGDGTIDMDKIKFLSWSQGFDNLDREILGCPYYSLKKQGVF